ncbi:VOC family protein [Planococcus sp. YIM B11945]|uniref:VOC family protein n=1 Tax=Planococcus sp. YIM B11945 TaxID=3435410 RepID=UPI003D7C627E
MYLDHIVHFTKESPQAAMDFWNQLGFPAVLGGQHIKWGTHNALFYSKNSYVEWLSLEKPEIAEQANHPLTALLLHDKIGFGTICLRTNAIDQVDSRLKGEGFKTSGVMNAERRTQEGKLIQWKMLFVKEAVSDQLPSPFFIEWQEDDLTRIENLKKSGAIQAENEQMKVEKCIFGVWDVEASSEKWQTLLGGELLLANCQIEFKQTEQEKERLEQVIFEGGSRQVSFEEGVYWVPEKGNNLVM